MTTAQPSPQAFVAHYRARAYRLALPLPTYFTEYAEARFWRAVALGWTKTVETSKWTERKYEWVLDRMIERQQDFTCEALVALGAACPYPAPSKRPHRKHRSELQRLKTDIHRV